MARFMNKIDAKGRFFVPAKARDGLGPRMYVTLSMDRNYLSVYSEERFQTIVESINSFSMTNPKIRNLRRAVIGEALECEIDSQGRISVTTELWEKIGAKPSTEICILQQPDMLEICTATYYEQSMEDEATYDFGGIENDIKGL